MSADIASGEIMEESPVWLALVEKESNGGVCMALAQGCDAVGASE